MLSRHLTRLAILAVLVVPVGAQEEQPGFGPPPVPKRTVPKLRIDEPDYDWGSLLQGEKKRHTFVLHNDGSGPLKLNNVKSSCGCTTVDWPKIIEPGAMGEVTLEINTSKLRQKRVKKYATIDTNDPSMPKQKVFIGGELIQIIDHTPKVITLQGLAGSVLEQKVIITPGSETSIEVKEVRARSRHVEVLNIAELEKGKRYEVSLRALASQRPAKLRDNLEVIVLTGDGKTRSSTVPVTVDHRDRVLVQPKGNVVFQRKDTVRLRTANAPPVVRPVLVSSGGPEVSFRILGVRLENVPEGLFGYEIQTLQEGKRYKINLKCLTHHSERFVRGQMVILTDDPESPERIVRLFAQFGNVNARAPARRPTPRPKGPARPPAKKAGS